MSINALIIALTALTGWVLVYAYWRGGSQPATLVRLRVYCECRDESR